MKVSLANLPEAVAAALTRLNALKGQPMSPTTAEQMPALNTELRELRKRLCDRMNALSWNEERKGLLDLRKKLDRALSGWEYESTVDVSLKRVNELETELLASALNDSQRRRLQRVLRQILALRKSFEQI